MAGLLTDGMSVLTTLTGAELAPFDTQAQEGQNPQTGAISTAQLASGAATVANTATSGATIALETYNSTFIPGAGTLAALTVQLEASPQIGMEQEVVLEPAVTALSVATTDGSDINGAASPFAAGAITAYANKRFRYYGATTGWVLV